MLYGEKEKRPDWRRDREAEWPLLTATGKKAENKDKASVRVLCCLVDDAECIIIHTNPLSFPRCQFVSRRIAFCLCLCLSLPPPLPLPLASALRGSDPNISLLPVDSILVVRSASTAHSNISTVLGPDGSLGVPYRPNSIIAVPLEPGPKRL